MSYCHGCGLPGYSPYCPVCAGDWDMALAHGLIQPPEPEPQLTPEEECAMRSGHALDFPLGGPGHFYGLGCWCGRERLYLDPAMTLPA